MDRPARNSGRLSLYDPAGNASFTGPDKSGGVSVPKRIYRCELAVEENSFLAGKTLLEAGFAKSIGYTLEAITRQGTPFETGPHVRLEAGDVLTFYPQADVLPEL